MKKKSLDEKLETIDKQIEELNKKINNIEIHPTLKAITQDELKELKTKRDKILLKENSIDDWLPSTDKEEKQQEKQQEEEAKAKAEAKEAGLTVEEVNTLKALVPKHVKKTLKDYAQRARKPLVYVYDLFYETYLPRGIEMISDTVEGQCEYALKSVSEELFDVPFIYGNPNKVKMEFKVFHVSDISTKKLKEKTASVAYVTGIFQTSTIAGGGESQHQASFGILTLWNDALQALPKFKCGRIYRMGLGVLVRCFYMELSKYKLEQNEPYEVTDNSVVLSAPTDILTIAFEPIDVKDAEKNVGYNRMLQGKIGKHELKVGSTGKQYGIIELVDFSDKRAKIKVSLFDNPQSALYYPEGTEVFVICTIDDNEKWGLQAIGKDIIPLHEMPTLIDKFEMTPEENEAIFGEDWLGQEGIDWESNIKDDGADDWNKTNNNQAVGREKNTVTETNISKPDKKKKSNLDDFDLQEWL